MVPSAAGASLDLTFMHVGGTVAHLETAMAEHGRLGVGPWAVSGRLDLLTYDGEAREIRPQPVRIAYGRMPGGGAVELVEPAPTSPPSPQRRLLEERPGFSHAAYWCPDVPSAMARLLDDGATLFSIAVGDGEAARRAWAAGGEAALVADARAGYLRLPSGAVVELVASSMDGAPMEAMLGREITAILPRPGARPA